MTKTPMRWAAALALLAAGCGGGKADLTQVSGTVTKGGQPLPGVRVTFSPEYQKGSAEGRSSGGLTDAQGKFSLTFNDQDNPRPGALPGKHKVTLTDVAWENDRENPERGPIRVPPEYQQSGSTPLSAEVSAGKSNVVDLEVK